MEAFVTHDVFEDRRKKGILTLMTIDCLKKIFVFFVLGFRGPTVNDNERLYFYISQNSTNLHGCSVHLLHT